MTGRSPVLDVPAAALEADPYPVYARLRREAPVAWIPSLEHWVVTRWADVDRVLGDPATFSARNDPVDAAFGRPNILSCDGPAHKDLRRALTPSLRPATVDGYIDDLVRPLAQARLDALLADGGGAELMAAYFEPVSVRSLAQAMGFADAEDATLRRWFAAMSLGASNYERDPDKQAINDAAVAELRATLDAALQRLAHDPDDSLLSHLLWAGTEGEPRPVEAVLPTINVLFLGGMQEPGHGAGTVLHLLLEHPEQLAWVREDLDGRLPAAIAEGLRVVAPIASQARLTTAPADVAGVTLPAGERVLACVASANHDEARFPDPARFDVHRDARRTASFGMGTHFCSGHAFARGLMRVALRVLLERVPDLRPDGEVVVTGFEFRAPRSLPVAWGRAG